jgi:uncharacterized protein YhbP (UPF0306 family)
MKERIDKYISQQTCANVCCVDDKNNPYCFSCFYSYNAEDGLMYYKSENDTAHSKFLLQNPVIAGTILPDKLNFLQIKGVQFEGKVLSMEDPLSQHATTHYYKKHPIALTMPGEIWTIQINHIKFTDNSFVFGEKISWNRYSDF